jgi:hypothetical protein
MTLSETEMNVLAVAMDHINEHLDDLVGTFETFEQEKQNLERIEAAKSLSSKLKNRVKTYYIK